MNAIVKKAIAEILRVLAAAILAAIGVEGAGCIACGDGATATCVSSFVPNK